MAYRHLGIAAIALGQLACTTILGDDFEIVPGASGGAGGSSSSTMGGQGGMLDCTPGEVTCSDAATLLICDDEGNPSTEACSGETPSCSEGECVACLEGEAQCTDAGPGSVVQTCEGNAWVDGDVCDIGCDAGACLTVTDIGAGSAHTCVALSNGTVRCWGYTNLDLLFVCQIDDPADPGSFTVTPTEVPGLTGVARIGSGNAHNCVVTEDDTLKCWGWNGIGRLGNGSVMNEPLPVDITLPDTVTDFTVGLGHTCVALSNGDSFCWGLNERGQVGNGEIDNPLFYNSPQQVINLTLPAVQLDSSSDNTCMRDSGKNAACWGNGSGGQLGSGVTESGSPVGIGGEGVDEIRIGDGHTCFRKGVEVSCFGRNNRGQVGIGNLVGPVGSPELVSTPNVTSLHVAGRRTCIIDGMDRLWCWGNNDEGQLGLGTSGPGTERTLPSEITAVGTIRLLALGHSHSCAVTTDEELLCWGANNHGQVGIGMESPVVDTPSRVVW